MSPRSLQRGVWSLAACLLLSPSLLAANWPNWRGPEGTGVSPETDLPVKWSETENIRWKTPLPDRGNATPIVWENQIFLTQAVGEERWLMSFDRATGKELWRAGTIWKENDPTHPTNPHSSSSPVTDGERVIAWFGSAGIFCYDLSGKELWKVDLGKQNHEWGYGSSPIIYKDLCILPFGPGDRNFLVALDKRSGKEAWRVDIPKSEPKQRTDGFAGKEGTVGTWSTPIVIKAGGRDEMIMCYPEFVQAFDPQTGKELWRCGGLNPLIYTSPMFGDGVVVGAGGFGGSTIAVKPGGMGDVTDTHRLWQKVRDKQRIGSGVITNGHLYILNTPGTAQCIELATGKTMWEERLQGASGRSESWSSMVLAGDKIYVSNQAGDCFVLKASPTFEKIATNAIDDGLSNCSIVPSNGDIFLRTHKHLWCISARK